MKSGKFDTPFDFNPSLNIENYHIEYVNLIEVCQGGPLVGQLSINGELISYYRFGGPFLYTSDCIYVPALIHSAFVLAHIDLKTNDVKLIGGQKGLISLEKMEGNKIYYYDSLERSSLEIYDLSEFKLSNQKDTPQDFQSKVVFDQYVLDYTNIKNVGEKRLKIGSLLINNQNLFKYDFGGPFLYNESFIIIPIYEKNLFRSGFKTAQINLYNKSIKIEGKLHQVIFLSSIEDNKIFYYTDLAQTKLETILLEY